MFETTGSLANVQPALTLVALALLPLLWTLLVLAFGRRSGGPDDEDDAREGVVAPTVAISAAVGTLGLAIVLATRLALLPRGYLLFQHVAQLGRLGQLDLAFDLALERRSAAFAVIVAFVACASTLHTAWSSRPRGAAVLGWTGLVTTGAMLLCVSDGFAALLVGLGLLSLGAWGLARGGGQSPNATSLAGNASILLGLVFLFWSLGGAFGPAGYDPDGAPRFVLVTTAVPSEAPQQATLSMTTHAGALVSSDDADLPGEPISAPFTIAAPPGIYTLRVQGGAASGDVVVPRVALVAGHTHVVTPYGPTASLRVLDDQVTVPRLATNGAPTSIRATLAARTIGGLRASAIVLLLLLGGALAHAYALANRRGPSAIASVLEAMPAAYLGLRIAPLVDPSSADGALVALLGAGSGLLIGANSACVDDAHKALRGILAATVAVALAAVGLGDPSGSIVLSCSSIVGGGAALAAIDARRDVRWLGIACAATVGLLPGAGASSGFMLAIMAALGSATTGTTAWALFAGGAAVAVVAMVMLVSLAAFRVYDAVLRASVRDPGVSRGQGAVVVVLSIVALVGGTTLGVGTNELGGSVVPLAKRIAGDATIQVPRGLGVAAVVLTVVASAGGVLLARRASTAQRPPAWLLAFGRPYAVLSSTGAMVALAARFLERGVRAMDRDVVDDVPAALRELFAPVGRIFSRTPPPGARVDPPPPGEPLLAVALLAMVALLGGVVLSSFVLG